MTLTDAVRLPSAAWAAMSHDADAGLTRALERLMALQDGDRAVLDAVACGADAVAPLRTLLFRREPSGLYQPRCRVVDALAALGARDVLRAFVHTHREISDPIELAGEEAVLNAAVRALRGEQDEAFFWRLVTLAATRRLAGPIELLGELRRPEALGWLVAALADDIARPVAQDAIRHYGCAAGPTLIAGAIERLMLDGAETESSRRRRRAALALLVEIGEAANLTREQRDAWVGDDDPGIALLGCRLALASSTTAERHDAVRRLLDILPAADWLLRRDIESCLIEYPDTLSMLRAVTPVGTVSGANLLPPVRGAAVPNPSYSVRPNGAVVSAAAKLPRSAD